MVKGCLEMIVLKDIEKEYTKGVKVVNNLNLEIKDGEIFGILGPNGAGKTTTINMITGIIQPTKGEVKINNIDINKKPVEAKMQFGYVPDSPDMFLRYKGIEYLNFIGDVYNVNKTDREKRIKELAERFNMVNSLGNKIQSYSHGMRQKIIIMGVLLHKPSVWILDEPLTGLDPKSSYILKEMMIEHAKEGNTVLFSTHVLEVAEKLCNRVGIIKNGKLIFVGTLEELKEEFKADETLEKMFLEITEDE